MITSLLLWDVTISVVCVVYKQSMPLASDSWGWDCRCMPLFSTEFLTSWFINYLFHVCDHTVAVRARTHTHQKRSLDSHYRWCWGLNSEPLEELSVLLIAEPSLQPTSWYFKKITHYSFTEAFLLLITVLSLWNVDSSGGGGLHITVSLSNL